MSRQVHVGPASAIEPGRPLLLMLPRSDTGWPQEAIVLRDSSGRLRAYLNQCRHLPIPLDGASRDVLSADGEHLECRTHGALYQLHDGLCIDGPCEGLSLHPISLEERDGELYLVIGG